MKSLSKILLVGFLSLAVSSQKVDAENDLRDEANNLHAELSRTLNLCISGDECELSTEQRRQIYQLKSDLRQAKQYLDRITGGRQQFGQRKRTGPNDGLYQKRFLEDIELFKAGLKTEILLPHQVRLFEKIQKRAKLEWHFEVAFTRTKGTEMEDLDLSAAQLKNFQTIQSEMQKEIKDEQLRYRKEIEAIKTEAAKKIRESMTKKQLEFLET